MKAGRKAPGNRRARRGRGAGFGGARRFLKTQRRKEAGTDDGPCRRGKRKAGAPTGTGRAGGVAQAAGTSQRPHHGQQRGAGRRRHPRFLCCGCVSVSNPLKPQSTRSRYSHSVIGRRSPRTTGPRRWSWGSHPGVQPQSASPWRPASIAGSWGKALAGVCLSGLRSGAEEGVVLRGLLRPQKELRHPLPGPLPHELLSGPLNENCSVTDSATVRICEDLSAWRLPDEKHYKYAKC